MTGFSSVHFLDGSVESYTTLRARDSVVGRSSRTQSGVLYDSTCRVGGVAVDTPDHRSDSQNHRPPLTRISSSFGWGSALEHREDTVLASTTLFFLMGLF